MTRVHAEHSGLRHVRCGRDQRQFPGLELAARSTRHRQRHIGGGVVLVATDDQHRQEDDRQRREHGGTDQAVFQGGVHRGGSERPERC